MKARIVGFILCYIICSCSHEPAVLHVISTTDLHGELGPNMSSIYSYIHDAREAYGDNLILLDGGDNLQGTPESNYSCYVDKADTSIYAQLFNAMQYDAMSV